MSLSWSSVANATSYNVKRTTASGAEISIAFTGSTSYTDTNVANNTTYYYVVSAIVNGAESGNSAEASVTVGSVGGSLVSGWTDSDIGNPGHAGSASYQSANGGWTVSGGGSDIWNNSDQFNFASEAVTGSSTLIAEITSITATDPWAKAGVMLRDTNAAGSAFVAVVATQATESLSNGAVRPMAHVVSRKLVESLPQLLAIQSGLRSFRTETLSQDIIP